MKRSFIRIAAIVLAMSILPNPLPTNHRYGNIIKNVEITAHAEDKWVKKISNTFIGTSVINNPRIAENDEDKWMGDYVYYGKYNSSPILYRVLDPDTTVFSDGQDDPTHTMFLDCNKTLFNISHSQVGKTYNWSNCGARTILNGEEFLLNNNYFSIVERNVIAPSTKNLPSNNDGKLDPDMLNGAVFSSLNSDYIFFLDAKEITNPSYGCGNYSGPRVKGGKNSSWWTRSFIQTNTKSSFISILSTGGFKKESYGQKNYGVSPAFNISLDSVIFSSVVTSSSNTGDDAKWGNKYKLTLKDPNTVLVPGNVTKDENTVTVPFTVNDLVTNDDTTSNRISVVIVDENNNIKLYEKLDTETEVLSFINGTASGTGTFTLPESYNSSTDKIYILAEDVHEGDDCLLTDYASELVEINIPTEAYDCVPYNRPTYAAPGNIEYYTHEDKFYKMVDDSYIEIEQEDTVIPKLEMTPSMYVSADSSKLFINILIPIAKDYKIDEYVVSLGNNAKELESVNIEGKDYGKLSVECAAKEMTDKFTLTILADNIEVYSKDISVKDYLDIIITAPEYAKYRNAATAMLRYGASAQIYFGHNTDNLESTTLSDLPDIDDTSPTKDQFSEAFDLKYSDYYAMNMTFTSDTTLLIAFKAKEDLSEDAENELKTKFINNEYTIDVIPDNSKSFYIVRVLNIPIKKLGEPIFTFGNVDVKATDYLSRIANNPDKPDDLRDLCKSLYAYYTAAKAL